MYLKSIEIQGFKSFAHKTQMNFSDGVTAIVGPNGSGKSNISDAVRWVLGEQKVKQLRGSAMQDVIFAGTEARKPQGFAFVAITLDNSDHALAPDYTEVTVSRRLFRSGESEYMLNGHNVRLKDIQELFYDTGIGKEGYSIIGQGQIEAIINGKPEDRRGLFDEAAGIVKFKRRKLTALKKLESERENLQRVKDIVDELSKRLKPLERQSASARQYLTLHDEQKSLDLNLFIREAGELLDDLKKAKENLQIVRDDRASAEEESEALKSRGSEVSDRLLALEETIDTKKNELSKAGLLKQNLESQIAMKELEIRSGKENCERYEEQLQKLQQDAEAGRTDSINYLHTISELEQSLKLLLQDEDALENLNADELKELGTRISGFKEDLKELLTEAVFEEELQKIKNAASGGTETEESGEAEEEEDVPDFVMPDWLKSIKSRKGDLERLREEEEQNNSWLSMAEEEYNHLTDRLKELQRAYSEKQQEMARVNARYESLRNIAERYEGFSESTRAVMREKDRIGGIRGVVADLFSTDKRYEQAIDIALGGRIQNIVTETERNAKAAVEYLKRTKQGRGTFLPLDAVRYREQAEYKAALKEHGVIGLASSLVKTEDCYRELAGYLLGSVLVVNSIDNALVIAGKYHHSLRIVTLEGELLSPGGSISGGAFRNSSNLMSRTRELEELKVNLHSAQLNCDQAKADIQANEKLVEEKNEEIERLNESRNDILNRKNELNYGLMSDLKLRYSELRQNTEFAAENIRRVMSVFRNSEQEKEELKEKQKACELQAEEDRKEIELRRDDISHIEEGVKKAEEELTEATAEKDSLAHSQSGFYERREELNGRILELEKDILRLENQIEKQQGKLDSQTDYIWGEYSLTLSTAQEFYREDAGNIGSIRTRLAEVKAAIRKLGPVNVQAIEEYREVSERYEFLKKQQDDLTASEDAVIGIIKELDVEMKRRFSEQFVLIRKQFAEVFSELFGGGKADLELVYDPELDGKDELEAGISINVQPPGKKLQNIMQLSGGEKALTAIALMFAIQNLKPSPFCLLDEIEAALDDSNVVRFSGYLHKLTDHTQFIVITHRRGTMESADRLYGVTMQEKGVSKLVSVDLITDSLT